MTLSNPLLSETNTKAWAAVAKRAGQDDFDQLDTGREQRVTLRAVEKRTLRSDVAKELTQRSLGTAIRPS